MTVDAFGWSGNPALLIRRADATGSPFLIGWRHGDKTKHSVTREQATEYFGLVRPDWGDDDYDAYLNGRADGIAGSLNRARVIDPNFRNDIDRNWTGMGDAADDAEVIQAAKNPRYCPPLGVHRNTETYLRWRREVNQMRMRLGIEEAADRQAKTGYANEV